MVHDTEAMLRRAIALQADGDDQAALPLLLSVILQRPGLADGWLQLTFAYNALARETEAQHADAALRILDPREASLWFSATWADSHRPYATLCQAAFLAGIAQGDDEQRLGRSEQLLRQLIGAPVSSARPAERLIAAKAKLLLADLEAATKGSRQALEVLDGLVGSSRHDADPRMRAHVASAYVTRGVLLAERDLTAALSSWQTVVQQYADEPTAAESVNRARANMMRARGEPDPVVQDPREQARRTRGGLAAVLDRLRDRPVRGIDCGSLVPHRRRWQGTALVWAGRAVFAMSLVLGTIALARGVIAEEPVSWRTLAFSAAAQLGYLLTLLGERRRGRFVFGVLAIVPQRLPRTILRVGTTLFAAWVSPFLAAAGILLVFGMPKATYGWLLDQGLPRYVDLAAMVVIAPMEVFLVCGLLDRMLTAPIRLVLGSDDPLVAAMEDAFGYVRLEGSPAAGSH